MHKTCSHSTSGSEVLLTVKSVCSCHNPSFFKLINIRSLFLSEKQLCGDKKSIPKWCGISVVIPLEISWSSHHSSFWLEQTSGRKKHVKKRKKVDILSEYLLRKLMKEDCCCEYCSPYFQLFLYGNMIVAVVA